MFSFKVTVKGTANMWTDEPYELIRSKVYEGVIDFQEFKYQVMRFTNDCSDNLNLILQSSNKVGDVKGINFVISISNSIEPNTGKLEYWVSDYNLKRYLDGNTSGPQIDIDVEKQCKDKVKNKLLEKVTNCYITVHDIKYTSTITINIVPYFDHVLNRDYNGEYFVSFSNWVLTTLKLSSLNTSNVSYHLNTTDDSYRGTYPIDNIIKMLDVSCGVFTKSQLYELVNKFIELHDDKVNDD